MALPSSGEITFATVNDQLKRSTTAAINLNDTQVRGLAGKASGAISMSDLHGKWAGEKMVCGLGNSYYGYSASATGGFAGVAFGSLTNRKLFGGVPNELLWKGGYLYIKMKSGEAKPTAGSVIIRDSNFGAVATVSLPSADWSDLAGWLIVAPLASNPFPSGATRWITWS